MKIISHRGNLDGPSQWENSPQQIRRALDAGFDVEVDVRYFNNTFYLGHDEAIYKVEESFLEDSRLWCHAKTLKALVAMLKNSKIRCFSHDIDDMVLTSDGYIWTFNGKKTDPEKSIIVDLTREWKNHNYQGNAFGVCTDYPNLWQK